MVRDKRGNQYKGMIGVPAIGEPWIRDKQFVDEDDGAIETLTELSEPSGEDDLIFDEGT